ncbi:tetratricopeptide repeat protein 5-like [Lolium rigidum]|uniref:tetratricopeptide repeat protein 5-like n=1 Tax=Lolium rigidum TaxID=89674 RepID=UPI001F5E1288|nr:tetratricopeptide repeat protein 5-like [Lolium rigidum]
MSSEREASGVAATSASPSQRGEGAEGADAGLERTADAVEELYRLRDTFFPRDPAEKPATLRARADAALAVLDSLPPEQRKSPQQRAVCEFLRGKILDVFPEYNKEAEDHLSKAVKLNPSLVDAWLCLGNCIWKKGDLASAKNCFVLALDKGADKKILCQLSMLERSMAQGEDVLYHIPTSSVDGDFRYPGESREIPGFHAVRAISRCVAAHPGPVRGVRVTCTSFHTQEYALQRLVAGLAAKNV